MAAKMDVSVVLRLVDQLVTPMKAATEQMKAFNKAAQEINKNGYIKATSKDMDEHRKKTKAAREQYEELGKEAEKTGKTISQHAKEATKHTVAMGKSIAGVVENLNVLGGSLSRVGGKTEELGHKFTDSYLKAKLLLGALTAVGPAARAAHESFNAWRAAGVSIDRMKDSARGFNAEIREFAAAKSFGEHIAMGAKMGGDAIQHHLVGGLTKFAASYAATSAAFGAAGFVRRSIGRAAHETGMQSFASAGIEEAGARAQQRSITQMSGLSPDDVEELSHEDGDAGRAYKKILKNSAIEILNPGKTLEARVFKGGAPAQSILLLQKQMQDVATDMAINSGTMTVAEGLAALNELREPSGSMEHVLKFGPVMAPLHGVLASITGSEHWMNAKGAKGASHSLFDIFKAAEFRQAANLDDASIARQAGKNEADVTEADRQRYGAKVNMENMTRIIVGSGGKLTPSDMHMTFKAMRASLSSLDDNYVYGFMPALMQEFKVGKHGSSQQAGTTLNALQTQLGGRMTRQAKEQWAALDFLDEDGTVKHDKERRANPVLWMHDRAIPHALQKMGYKLDDDKDVFEQMTPEMKHKLQQMLGKQYSNRTAEHMATIFTMDWARLLKTYKYNVNIPKFDAISDANRESPAYIMGMFYKQWNNMTGAIMKPYTEFVMLPIVKLASIGLDANDPKKRNWFQSLLVDGTGNGIFGGMRGIAAAHSKDPWVAAGADITMLFGAFALIWQVAKRVRPLALIMTGLSLGGSFGGTTGAIAGGIAGYGLTRMVASAAASGGLASILGAGAKRVLPAAVTGFAGSAAGGMLGKVFGFANPGMLKSLGLSGVFMALASFAGLTEGFAGFVTQILGFFAVFFPWLRIIYGVVLLIIGVFNNWDTIIEKLKDPGKMVTDIWDLLKEKISMLLGLVGWSDKSGKMGPPVPEDLGMEGLKEVHWLDIFKSKTPPGNVTINVNGAGDPKAVGDRVYENFNGAHTDSVANALN